MTRRYGWTMHDTFEGREEGGEFVAFVLPEYSNVGLGTSTMEQDCTAENRVSEQLSYHGYLNLT